MTVHSSELYENAWSFPRVRRYDVVMQGMDMLQHFEDNLNENFENTKHVSDFVKAGKTVQAEFNAKYHDGEFSDPANYDPEDEHKPTWATITV